jgi:hypothetical protein
MPVNRPVFRMDTLPHEHRQENFFPQGVDRLRGGRYAHPYSTLDRSLGPTNVRHKEEIFNSNNNRKLTQFESTLSVKFSAFKKNDQPEPQGS